MNGWTNEWIEDEWKHQIKDIVVVKQTKLLKFFEFFYFYELLRVCYSTWFRQFLVIVGELFGKFSNFRVILQFVLSWIVAEMVGDSFGR